MRAFIEQIEVGHEEIRLPFGIRLKRTPDKLDIANQPSAWVFDVTSRQLGQFAVERPHSFKEREWVEVNLGENGRIKEVKKETDGK